MARKKMTTGRIVVSITRSPHPTEKRYQVTVRENGRSGRARSTYVGPSVAEGFLKAIAETGHVLKEREERLTYEPPAGDTPF